MSDLKKNKKKKIFFFCFDQMLQLMNCFSGVTGDKIFLSRSPGAAVPKKLSACHCIVIVFAKQILI